MKDALLLKNVSVSYYTKAETIAAIQDLSLQVGQGEVLALLGPSGCGKSTLINALAGTIPIGGGTMEYRKNDETRPLHPQTHKIGVIPQTLGLLPWKTVRANCLLPLAIRGQTISEQKQRQIDGIGVSLGITNLLERYPKELSGGQAQRAAIARAFICEPDLLLMDEPFSSLDAINRGEACELFLRIWKRFQPTAILVTHSIEEALYLGTTIVVVGRHMGDTRHRMPNPFFAQSHPQSLEYLELARLLRDSLKPQEEGGEPLA